MTVEYNGDHDRDDERVLCLPEYSYRQAKRRSSRFHPDEEVPV